LTDVLKIFPSTTLSKEPLSESNNLSKNKKISAVSAAPGSMIDLATKN